MSEKKPAKCVLSESGRVYEWNDGDLVRFAPTMCTPAVAVPQEAYNKARGLLSGTHFSSPVDYATLRDAIARAIDEARKVPDGYVREGVTDRKVLGTLFLTGDGCVLGIGYGGCLYREPVCGDIERRWPSVAVDNIDSEYTWFSTRAAAEAARKGGE